MLTVYNTTRELSDSGIDTAVIPLGSVEGKGPHLPIGSDLILAEAFAFEYCRDKNVYLTPAIPFGTSCCQRGFKGTIYLDNETLWETVCDLVNCLKMHELKRVIILNFCSYNWVVKPAARELNLSIGECEVIWVEPKHLVADILAEHLGQFPDYHAGALETSFILYLDESLVKEPVEDFVPDFGREYLDYVGMKAISPLGVWGKPGLASKELGWELFQKMLERTDGYIKKALSIFQHDTELLKADSVTQYTGDSLYESPVADQNSDTPDWFKSYRQITAVNPEIAIVTVSATEQHSSHLPLGTDFFSGVIRSRLLAEEIGAYLVPPLPIVTSWGHTGFRGTLMLRSLTARKFIMDVVRSLYEDGFRKVVLMPTHGGNWIAKPTVIELNHKYPDLNLIYAGGDALYYRGQSNVNDLHSGAGETSFIMDYYPQCLKQPVRDFSPQVPASFIDYVGMRGLSPTGVWGCPSKASKGSGIQSVQNGVKSMSEYIKDTFSKIEGMSK